MYPLIRIIRQDVCERAYMAMSSSVHLYYALLSQTIPWSNYKGISALHSLPKLILSQCVRELRELCLYSIIKL